MYLQIIDLLIVCVYVCRWVGAWAVVGMDVCVRVRVSTVTASAVLVGVLSQVNRYFTDEICTSI